MTLWTANGFAEFGDDPLAGDTLMHHLLKDYFVVFVHQCDPEKKNTHSQMYREQQIDIFIKNAHFESSKNYKKKEIGLTSNVMFGTISFPYNLIPCSLVWQKYTTNVLGCFPDPTLAWLDSFYN